MYRYVAKGSESKFCGVAASCEERGGVFPL